MGWRDTVGTPGTVLITVRTPQGRGWCPARDPDRVAYGITQDILWRPPRNERPYLLRSKTCRPVIWPGLEDSMQRKTPQFMGQDVQGHHGSDAGARILKHKCVCVQATKKKRKLHMSPV